MVVVVCALTCVPTASAYDTALLRNMATRISNDLLSYSDAGLQHTRIQNVYDAANYTVSSIDLSNIMTLIESELSVYFSEKETAVSALANRVLNLYTQHNSDNPSYNGFPDYFDADLPARMPSDLTFIEAFKYPVSTTTSVIKVPDNYKRSDRLIRNAIAFSAGVDTTFQSNYANDPSIRWQYFGSETGIHRTFPGKQWPRNFMGFPKDYDPRFRPWYIAATSGPKDVVIVIDCSSSMAGKKGRLAKSIARAIISTLTQKDFVTLICAKGSYYDLSACSQPNDDDEGTYTSCRRYVYAETYVASCLTDRLLPATSSHREELADAITSMRFEGATRATAGLRKAYDILATTPLSSGCQKMIVYISDGLQEDPAICSTVGSTKYKCQADYNDASNFVQGKRLLDIPVFTFSVRFEIEDGFGGRYTDYSDYPLHTIGCTNSKGYFAPVNNSEGVRDSLAGMYNYLALSARGNSVVWTDPYVDALGQGLMVTATKTIFDASVTPARLVGVVGVDAVLTSVEALIRNRLWGTVYAFLINNDGDVLMHPNLLPAADLISDPVYPKIQFVERGINSTGMTQMINNMMQRSTGSYATVQLRTEPRGDRREGTLVSQRLVQYTYRPITGSQYSFAFVLSLPDDYFLRTPLPLANETRTSYYHLLQMYNQFLPGIAAPLNIQQTTSSDRLRPNSFLSLTESSVKLAPRAFCDSLRYVSFQETTATLQRSHAFINRVYPLNITQMIVDLGCSDSRNVYADFVTRDVPISRSFQDAWFDRSSSVTDDIVWTYFGSVNGVFRIYPGHRMPRKYDPSRRPWYFRGFNGGSNLALSTPYVDAAGAGKVITFSRAILEGTKGFTLFNTFNDSNTQAVKNIMAGVVAQTINFCQGDNNGKTRSQCYCFDASTCQSGFCVNNICTNRKVEGVVGMDLQYDTFHQRVSTQLDAACTAAGSTRCPHQCGSTYTCAIGSGTCTTKCYIIDETAQVVYSPTFFGIPSTNDDDYQQIPLSFLEGSVMRDLFINKLAFTRSEVQDYQAVCSFERMPRNLIKNGTVAAMTIEQLEDEYELNRGLYPFPPFGNSVGCTADSVWFTANPSQISEQQDQVLTSTFNGACGSGTSYLTAIPSTNSYLLVVDNYKGKPLLNGWNMRCLLENGMFMSGSYEITNGTCSDRSTSGTIFAPTTCPERVANLNFPCLFKPSPAPSLLTSFAPSTLCVSLLAVVVAMFNRVL